MNEGFNPVDGCDDNRRANVARTLALRDETDLMDWLQRAWPSDGTVSQKYLWTEAWNVFGTCVSTIEPRCYTELEPGQDVIRYFRNVKALAEEINLKQVLQQLDLTPIDPNQAAKSQMYNGYHRHAVEQGLGHALNRKVLLRCDGWANDQLREIRVYWRHQPGVDVSRGQPATAPVADPSNPFNVAMWDAVSYMNVVPMNAPEVSNCASFIYFLPKSKYIVSMPWNIGPVSSRVYSHAP
ncbi:Ribonuclease T2-like [Dimargaris verticillata]|uniref:Ribonuclease T2-like n=1 Tax=Dimargaris verticillata TaxID=2761393 RepID=A0A9W8B9V7_9FUNG|nr:Ribonuclease T2-like [Dimargaris verticillata]